MAAAASGSGTSASASLTARDASPRLAPLPAHRPVAGVGAAPLAAAPARAVDEDRARRLPAALQCALDLRRDRLGDEATRRVPVGLARQVVRAQVGDARV